MSNLFYMAWVRCLNSTRWPGSRCAKNEQVEEPDPGVCGSADWGRGGGAWFTSRAGIAQVRMRYRCRHGSLAPNLANGARDTRLGIEPRRAPPEVGRRSRARQCASPIPFCFAHKQVVAAVNRSQGPRQDPHLVPRPMARGRRRRED